MTHPLVTRQGLLPRGKQTVNVETLGFARPMGAGHEGEECTLRHLLGGRKAAAIVGLFAVLALSITPQATAATGVSSGAHPFCLDNGDCGTMVLNANYVNVIGRGGAVTWECVVSLPTSATNPNYLAVSITGCTATNLYEGTTHHGLQAGNAGPATATAGGTTTDVDYGYYEVCVEGYAAYIDGPLSFSECSDIYVNF